MTTPRRAAVTTESIARRGPILDLRPMAKAPIAAPLPTRVSRAAPRPVPRRGPVRTFDGRVIRRPLPSRPTRAAAVEAVQKLQTAPKPSTGNRLLYFAQYPVIAAAALGMAFSVDIGQVLILLYGLFTVVRRRDSRGPFIVALVMLVAIPGFQIIGLTSFSENAAIYAYELLVVGVVTAIFETVRLGKTKPV